MFSTSAAHQNHLRSLYTILTLQCASHFPRASDFFSPGRAQAWVPLKLPSDAGMSQGKGPLAPRGSRPWFPLPPRLEFTPLPTSQPAVQSPHECSLNWSVMNERSPGPPDLASERQAGVSLSNLSLHLDSESSLGMMTWPFFHCSEHPVWSPEG